MLILIAVNTPSIVGQLHKLVWKLFPYKMQDILTNQLSFVREIFAAFVYSLPDTMDYNAFLV